MRGADEFSPEPYASYGEGENEEATKQMALFHRPPKETFQKCMYGPVSNPWTSLRRASSRK